MNLPTRISTQKHQDMNLPAHIITCSSLAMNLHAHDIAYPDPNLTSQYDNENKKSCTQTHCIRVYCLAVHMSPLGATCWSDTLLVLAPGEHHASSGTILVAYLLLFLAPKIDHIPL